MSITALGLRAPGPLAGTTYTPTRDVMAHFLASTDPPAPPPAPPPTPPAPPTPAQLQAQQLAGVLSTLTAFIPGDILTLYLAIQSTLKSAYGPFTTLPIDPSATLGAKIDFAACLLFTIIWIPILRALAAKANASTFEFPFWPIFAGVASFIVYALAVDFIWLNPPNTTRQEAAFIAIGVILTSTLLTLFNKVIKVWRPSQAV